MNVGHGKHAATKKGCDFGRADLIILGFPAVDRFHVQGMAEYEIDLSVFNDEPQNCSLYFSFSLTMFSQQIMLH